MLSGLRRQKTLNMRNHTWYKCSDSKTGNWPEAEYYISFGNASNRSITIWLNNAAACTGIKSVKAAYKILTDEFNSVEKIDR